MSRGPSAVRFPLLIKLTEVSLLLQDVVGWTFISVSSALFTEMPQHTFLDYTRSLTLNRRGTTRAPASIRCPFGRKPGAAFENIKFIKSSEVDSEFGTRVSRLHPPLDLGLAFGFRAPVGGVGG